MVELSHHSRTTMKMIGEKKRHSGIFHLFRFFQVSLQVSFFIFFSPREKEIKRGKASEVCFLAILVDCESYQMRVVREFENIQGLERRRTSEPGLNKEL